MEQYINKDALVKEIERLDEFYHHSKGAGGQAFIESMLSFIDTLDVKKVDLEKEFDNYTKNILACDVQFEPFTHLYNCAKYFFELGLKAQKEE